MRGRGSNRRWIEGAQEARALFSCLCRNGNPAALFISNHKIHGAGLIGIYCDRFLPGFWFGEDGALHGVFGEDVVGLLLAGESPAFMPGDNLIRARRNAGELEAPAFVGNGVVRMWDHHHFRIHPDMAAVAAQVDQAGRRHSARSDLIGEREWQVKAGRAIHVDGVQSRIGALHLQSSILGHEKNVRNVAAMFLIEMTALLGQFERFSGGDVLEIDDRVGHAAVGSEDQAIEANRFLTLRIADLRILGDGKVELVWDWSRPFDGAGDGSAVVDGDDAVVALGCGKGCKDNDKGESQQKTSSTQIAHTRKPLKAHRPFRANRSAVVVERGLNFWSVLLFRRQRLTPNLRDSADRIPQGRAALVFAVVHGSNREDRRRFV